MIDWAWIGDVRARGVAAVAQVLGLEVERWPDGRPKAIHPCPLCLQEKRHRKSRDKRGAIGLRPDGRGWHCHQCEATGDAVDLASAITLGRLKPKGAQEWQAVRAACAEQGLIEGASAAGRSGPPALSVARRREEPAEPAPPRLPHAEVEALWTACTPVIADAAVASWMRSRQLDPMEVATRDLARSLPQNGVLPKWAALRRRAWPDAGYRAVLPLYDASGSLVSVRVRRIVSDGDLPKAVCPADASVRGLVMANALGRDLLKRGAFPLVPERIRRVIFVEGEPDFLTRATQRTDGIADAVIGIFSGSWSAELAARIPNRTKVIVRQHLDATGDRYAEPIIAALRERCEVYRRRARQEGEAHAEG